jgi:hypothetical protein
MMLNKYLEKYREWLEGWRRVRRIRRNKKMFKSDATCPKCASWNFKWWSLSMFGSFTHFKCLDCGKSYEKFVG